MRTVIVNLDTSTEMLSIEQEHHHIQSVQRYLERVREALRELLPADMITVTAAAGRPSVVIDGVTHSFYADNETVHAIDIAESKVFYNPASWRIRTIDVVHSWQE